MSVAAATHERQPVRQRALAPAMRQTPPSFAAAAVFPLRAPSRAHVTTSPARAPPTRTSASATRVTPTAVLSPPTLQLDVARFLRETWGQRPAYLPGLLPSYAPPLDADDLAGLSTCAAVESRIITGRGCGLADDPPYTLSVGPFSDATYASPLCADGTPWTLLVQELNAHVPAVSELLDTFRVVPNWRVDDVMASYATARGGVGPHVDDYDVFLLQVSGTRRWRARAARMSAEEERTALLPRCDVRVLAGGFEADVDRVLGPGDCLYVPPRCPHWGEALSDDCVTFSIGFRAPRVADLARGWVEDALEGRGDLFLGDCREELGRVVGDPGRITERAMDDAYDEVLRALRGEGGRGKFRKWFCEQVTAPKRFREGGEDAASEEEVRATVAAVLQGDEGLQEEVIRQREGCVFAYAADGEVGGGGESGEGAGGEVAMLYIDGESVGSCSVGFAKLVCGGCVVPCAAFADEYAGICAEEKQQIQDVLGTLFRRELLYIEAPDDEEDEDDVFDD